jgi:hypothetical protein
LCSSPGADFMDPFWPLFYVQNLNRIKMNILRMNFYGLQILLVTWSPSGHLLIRTSWSCGIISDCGVTGRESHQR